MSESAHLCTAHDINKIADDLNNGNKDAVWQNLTKCTAEIGIGSSYNKTRHAEGAPFKPENEPAPSAADKHDFAKLANDERHLWKSIADAAHHKNPAGLCKLSIEEAPSGPAPVISGAPCEIKIPLR